jgi:hypothetical protein
VGVAVAVAVGVAVAVAVGVAVAVAVGVAVAVAVGVAVGVAVAVAVGVAVAVAVGVAVGVTPAVGVAKGPARIGAASPKDNIESSATRSSSMNRDIFSPFCPCGSCRSSVCWPSGPQEKHWPVNSSQTGSPISRISCNIGAVPSLVGHCSWKPSNVN